MRHLAVPVAYLAGILLVFWGCPEDAADDDTTEVPGDDDDTTADDDDSGGPIDADGDGYPEGEDCDDDDPTAFPGAPELCDGVDNDCNGEVDDDPVDSDGDGYDDCVDPTPQGYDGGAGREQPLSLQLHLHGSLSEFDGTMSCHTEQAETYGVDVLWWSDHDNMLTQLQRTGGFDFDTGSFSEDLNILGRDVIHEIETLDVTFDPAESEVIEGGPSGAGYYWRVGGTDAEADDAWSWAQHQYAADDGTSHHVPLMSDVTVRLALNPDQAVGPDWQLLFTITLSATCDGQLNQITYYLGGDDLTSYTSDIHLYAPLTIPPAGSWTELSMLLTADAAHFPEGDDQSATDYALELRTRNGATAAIGLDDLALEWQLAGDDLRDYQRQVLDDRYSDGSVTHFVGQEITVVADGQHLNPFGDAQIPFIDYLDTGMVTPTEGTQHVHDAGGIVQCNHPFGAKVGLYFEGEDADLQVDLHTELWLNGDAFACDLVEVGYRSRNVDLDHHLMFWDNLSDAGHYITGTGTNDHHWTSDWLDFLNPFLTWVFQDVPSRAGITDELAQGRAFFGDPGPFVEQEPLLDLWTEHGAGMGQVLASDLDQVVHVETGYLECGWSLDLVVDGEVHTSLLLDGSETDTVFELERGEIKTIRAQILDDEGTIILLSNPLWLVMPEEAEKASLGPGRVLVGGR